MARVDFDGANALERRLNGQGEGLLGKIPGACQHQKGVGLVALLLQKGNRVGHAGSAFKSHFYVHGHGHGSAALKAQIGQGHVVAPDAVNAHVGVLGRVNPLVVVPVKHHSRLAFGDAHKVFGARMLEAPLRMVATHDAPKCLVADDSAQLHEVERTHHVGRHLVGELAVKVVGRSAGRLTPRGLCSPLRKGA